MFDNMKKFDMLNFCTLFDSNFLRYGITMYESIREHCSNFHLYIFAFDDTSYDSLKKLNLDKATVISLKEFEDKKLLEIKPSRSKGEYCWTCTSSTILYCLKKFNLDHCTYVDSDVYFYSNPKVLTDELGDKSVLITEHRYTKKYERSNLVNGKYCVQFITFKNNEQGLKVLNWWRDACIDWCYAKHEDGKFGDQKYLDDWTERFEGVHVLKHLGGGVAPWNIQQYKIMHIDNELYLKEKLTKNICEMVFYHYHNVKFDGCKVNPINYLGYYIPKNAENLLYKPYLKHMQKINSIEKILLPTILDRIIYYSNKVMKVIKWLISLI
jgi:hypothetical protein